MNKKLLFSTALVLMTFTGTTAQEKLFNGVNVQSPVKNADGTVTLQLFAPQARQVSVSGDFLPTTKVTTPAGDYDAPGKAQLTNDGKGLWSYTSSPLAPQPSAVRRWTPQRMCTSSA